MLDAYDKSDVEMRNEMTCVFVLPLAVDFKIVRDWAKSRADRLFPVFSGDD